MPSLTSEREDLSHLHTRYADSRDPELRAELVTVYSDVVRSVARRYAGRGETLDDLVQVGFVGLLAALDRFDPHRGYPFIAFAVPTIVGELKRHFRDHRWRIRVSRELQERYLHVRTTRDRLVQTLGRSPTLADIAAELGMTSDDVAEAMEAGRTFSMPSLDSPTRAGAPQQCTAREKGYDAVEDTLYLKSLLAAIPEPQRRLLELRFGAELTQAEIGRRVGMGQMQVSRELTRTLSSLRALSTA